MNTYEKGPIFAARRAHAALERRRHAIVNSSLVARLTRRRPVLCLGDSHIRVFDHINRRRLVPDVRFFVFPVDGATAQGLVNPNARTDALRLFARRLRRAKTSAPVVFQLGEVDCGFVIWYRAEKHGVSVESQLERSITAYRDFLSHTRDDGFERIVVLSVPLPTIADDQTWGAVADARRDVTTTQRERTDLTLRYNALLEEACAGLGIRFLDVTSPQLDPETGLVSSVFTNADPLDHHLDDEAYANLIADRLAPVLAGD
jgi:hypothetical protein